MANISWTNSSGGSWTLGSNWSNGNVPGPSDNATIAIAPANGLSGYTVDIADTVVTVRSVTLDQSAATLLVGDGTDVSVLITHLNLEAGTLALENAALEGKVTQTGGQLVLEGYGFNTAYGTLQSVVWQGDLNPSFYGQFPEGGELTIDGSLTLTGADGNGPGTLTLDETSMSVYFAGQQTLNNATVALGGEGEFGFGPYYAPSLAGDTLTLGNHLVIDVTNSASIVPYTQITNDGTISTSGTANLYIGNPDADSGTFLNDAQIAVAANGTLSIASGDFVNSGTVTVAAGAAVEIDQAYGGSLQNTGSFVVDGALEFGATLTTQQLQTLVPDFALGADAAIVLAGTLVNTGADLTVGAGGIVPYLTNSGTILGGTVTALTENTLSFQNGELDGVTVNGSFSITGSSNLLSIVGGIQLASGTMSVIGADDTVSFLGTQTLDNTVLVLGSPGGDTLTSGAFGNGTGALTLSTSTQVVLDGGSGVLGGEDSQGSILEQGNVTATADAFLSIGEGIPFVNEGDISVAGNSTLFLDYGFSSSGSVSVQDSTLLLGDVNVSLLSEITLVNSNVAVAGILTATGSTLDVGTGSDLGDVRIGVTDPDSGLSDAAIVGGTIHDSGDGLQVVGTVTLSDVTYQGALKVTAAYANLTLSSVTLQSENGDGPGKLVLSGAASMLQIGDGETLDNATVDIGSAVRNYGKTNLSAPTIMGQVTGNSGEATLGAHLVVDQTAKYAAIGASVINVGGYGINTIFADGTINAAFAGGQMTLDGGLFVNSGTIAIGAEIVTSAAASFVDYGNVTVAAGGTLALNLLNYYQLPPDSGSSFENAGQITLSGGTISEESSRGVPPVPLLNDATGSISGAGTVTTELTNHGTITAVGGELTLSRAISGDGGALDVAAGATLSLLSSVSSGQVAQFGGAGGVLGLSGHVFLGEIGGFAVGDTIDLLKLTAKSAQFVGSSIVVTLSHGGTIALATTQELTGSLTVTGDGHGGSLIGFADTSLHPAVVPAIPAQWMPPQLEPQWQSLIWDAMAHHGGF